MDNWIDAILGKVAIIKMGQSPDSRDCNDNERGQPFLQGNAEFGVRYPTAIHYCVKPRKISKPKDVLVSVRAPVGEINISDRPYCIGRGIAAIEAEKGFSEDYLYYMLQISIHYLKRITQGTTFESVNKGELSSIPIKYPINLLEQKQISAILHALDKAIDNTKAQIEKNILIKQGLMNDLFTKGIDEKGNIRNERTHKFKDSPLGRIPEEWDIKELQKVGTIQVSNVDKKSNKGEVPVKLCNYIDVYKNQYIDSRIDFMNASATNAEINKFSLEIGDVMFTKDSETPDDIAVPSVVIENIDNLVCGYHLAVVRPNKSVINGLFLMKALQLSHVNRHFRNMASGMTRFGLTQKAIFTAKIPVPKDIKEQEIIENTLSKIDTLITDEYYKLSKLELLKAGLMQDLLTAKVRVNHLIKKGASA